MLTMFKFYQRIFVENFDMMLVTLNLEMYLQLEITLKKRMSTKFNLEIQSEHFRNGKMISIEGCMIDVFDQDLNSNMEFHSHLSDDSR